MEEWIKNWNLTHLLVSAAIIVGAVILWKLFRRAFLRFSTKRAGEGGVQGSAGTALTA